MSPPEPVAPPDPNPLTSPTDQAISSQSPWPHLPVDTPMTVVKLDPDGIETIRYPGRVIDAHAPTPWLTIEATWVLPRIELNGLVFEPGDRLHEHFSPIDPFNAFAIFAPDGTLRGWYANVTHPALLDLRTTPPNLTWHDLYLDVIVLPDGPTTLRDEDELAAAGLVDRNPPLHALILHAKATLLALISSRGSPFHERPPDALVRPPDHGPAPETEASKDASGTTASAPTLKTPLYE